MEDTSGVTVLHHVWIPMRDGVRLAARVWLPPEAGEATSVPAILEYHPYRKGDVEASADARRFSFFAASGYAGLRVDLRGSGDSEGVLRDEYTSQEHDDAVDVIDWIAQQPWSNGSVGMMGYSWGGFNALQVAALHPPALKAVIAMMCSDDRYSDDVHFLGGALAANMGPAWATTVLALSALPPDPETVGPDWRAMWMGRLNGVTPVIEPWLSHQRRDAYWKHGSVCEDYSAIRCPVYAIGGWDDGYRDAVFRLVERLKVPCKGLIGPWYHLYPQEQGQRAIGFLQECIRWWDRWLRDDTHDNGIMDEPKLRLWLQDAVEPATHYDERYGTWIAERSWPSAGIEPEVLFLSGCSLDSSPSPERTLIHKSLESTGLDGGFWCAFGYPGDWPPDQRADEGRSLTFTTRPLASTAHLVGQPSASLKVAVDAPQGNIVVRLSLVSPSGASTLLTRGFLNLAHRDGHEHPRALEPGRYYMVRIPMQSVAQVVPEGYRLRLAISTVYWPWIWPSPTAVQVSVVTGVASWLELPVRKSREADGELPSFAPPTAGAGIACEVMRSGSGRRENHVDLMSGRCEQRHEFFDYCIRFGDGLEIDFSGPDTYSVTEGDPLSARFEASRRYRLRRGEWDVRVEVDGTMTSDVTSFYTSTALRAYEGDRPVWSKDWTDTIARDHL